MSTARGLIRFRDYAEQGRDFSGLRFGKTITPTDIDCSMDFGGEHFVFLEAKFGDEPLPGGQRLHLEFLCRRLTQSRANAIAIVLTHDIPVHRQIPFADLSAREHFTARVGWTTARAGTNCRTLIEEWLDLVSRKTNAT